MEDLEYSFKNKQAFFGEISRPITSSSDMLCWRYCQKNKDDIAYAYQALFEFGDYSFIEYHMTIIPQWILDKFYFEKIRRPHKVQTYRAMNRIKKILYNSSKGCAFLTFTFNDLTLSKTTRETRRRYVSRYLKRFGGADYIANIDFGKLNHREHYHAIISEPRLDADTLRKWSKLGTINIEPIRVKSKSKLGGYITKLYNHSIKASTGVNNRLIYARAKS